MRHALRRLSQCEPTGERRMNIICGRTLNPSIKSPDPLKNDLGPEAEAFAPEENI